MLLVCMGMDGVDLCTYLVPSMYVFVVGYSGQSLVVFLVKKHGWLKHGRFADVPPIDERLQMN